ncbi:MAG: BREX-1 system adenine-specific DNA-methyltransferase PglX [Janthinobacterium lividum]
MNQEKNMEKYLFRASAADFKKIPGSPIAYWAPKSVIDAFENGTSLGDLVHARIALATGDNGAFVRGWWEVSLSEIGFGMTTNEESVESGRKWFPCNKGGDFRKWYGNNENLVNWFKDGEAVKSLVDMETGRVRSHNYNGDFGFQESVTWSALSSGKLGVRFSRSGFMFVTPGSSAFKKAAEANLFVIQALLSSNLADYFLRLISATMNIEVGNVLRIPFIPVSPDVVKVTQSAISLSQYDWDASEVSWDFTSLPLMQSEFRQPSLQSTYSQLRAYWSDMTLEMQRLEEENNRIFINAYGLQDELKPEVPLKEITLTCNPHYRYGGDKTEAELETQLQSDTMTEFLSYAVACMFGRYSLDKAGLVLANQGDTLAEYLHQIPEPRFMPDEDNVIPLLDGEWFADDVTERFRTFLRVTFGEIHYEANLAFIEQSLGKDVRKYFLKDFYAEHVKRYKKRPIYWLFSSPKGTFSALIYLHRYRPDTVSVVLRYLRDFRKKLAARLDYLQQVGISTSASQGEKTRALKEIETLKKQLLELDDYERDTLYPLATEQVALDLDDGVKVNYLKLGSALKKIIGLDSKED